MIDYKLIEEVRKELRVEYACVTADENSGGVYSLIAPNIGKYWYVSDGNPYSSFSETSSVSFDKDINVNDIVTSPGRLVVEFKKIVDQYSDLTLSYTITDVDPDNGVSTVTLEVPLKPWIIKLEPSHIEVSGPSPSINMYFGYYLYDQYGNRQSIVDYYSAYGGQNHGDPDIYFELTPLSAAHIPWNEKYLKMSLFPGGVGVDLDGGIARYHELSSGMALDRATAQWTTPINFSLKTYVVDDKTSVRLPNLYRFVWPYYYNTYASRNINSQSKRYWMTFENGSEFPPAYNNYYTIPDYKCKWRVQPNDGFVTMEGIGKEGLNYNTRYTISLDSDGWSQEDYLGNIGTIEVYSSNTLQTYAITMSSNFTLRENGQYYDEAQDFKPYKNLESGDSLYIRVSAIDYVSSAKTYNIQLLGLRKGVEETIEDFSSACVPLIGEVNNTVNEGVFDELFNINPAQLIVYRATWPDDVLVKIRDNNFAEFSLSDYPDSCAIVSDLYLTVYTNEVLSDPPINRISLSAYAVSASEIPNCSIIARGSTDFDVMDWVSNTVLDARFKINNENETTNLLYRDMPSSDMYYLTCFDTSIYPPNCNSTILFKVKTIRSDSISNDSLSISAFEEDKYVSFGDHAIFEIPKGYFDDDNGTTDQYKVVFSVGMSATVSNEYWAGTQTMIANPKEIHFVKDINSLVCNSIAYPSLLFENGVYYENTNVNPVISGFANCDDRSIYLSAISFLDDTVYNDVSSLWYINNIKEKNNGYVVTTDNNIYKSILYDFGDVVDGKWEIDLLRLRDTSIHNITVGMFNNIYETNMTPYYYDDVTGEQNIYSNFSILNSGLQFYSIDDVGNSVIMNWIDEIVSPDNSISLQGSGEFVGVPFVYSSELFNTFYWTISNSNWITNITISSPEINYKFMVSNDVSIGIVPNFYAMKHDVFLRTVTLPEDIDDTPGIKVKRLCIDVIELNESIAHSVTTYPIIPSIYTANNFVLTGEDVYYYNVLPAYTNLNFVWTCNDIDYDYIESISPFITSYNTTEKSYVKLTTNYDNYDNQYTYNVICTAIEVLTEFLTHDTDYKRVYNSVELQLPYPDQLALMPINEWCSYKTFNKVIDNFEANLKYLDDMCKIYDVPPTKYVGWLGTLDVNKQYTYWHVNLPNLNYVFNNPQYGENGRFTNIKDIYVAGNNEYYTTNTMIIAESTKLFLLSADYLATPISERNYKTIGDYFAELISIDVDSDGKIYTLDKIKNRVIVFKYDFDLNDWLIIYEWGGLGGTRATNKFNSPKKLLLNSNSLWIYDFNNSCLKQFNKSGNWMSTISNSYITTNVVNFAFDSDNNIHLLSNDNTCTIINTLGEFIDTYSFVNTYNADAIDIIKSKDDGFMYILLKNSIIKVLNDGTYAGKFADTFDIRYDYKKLFHDTHRNLYITNNNLIIKYVDMLSRKDLRMDVDYHAWPVSALYVNKEEYNQSWILNKSFSRLWDNLEIFRRTIIGKPESVLDNDGNVKLNVTNHTLEEYHPFTWQKNQIYIGINELVTSNVINRCFSKLNDCVNYLKELLDDNEVIITPEIYYKDKKRILCDDINVVIRKGLSYEFDVNDLNCAEDYEVNINDIFNEYPTLGEVSLKQRDNGDYYIEYTSSEEGVDSFKINYKYKYSNLISYRVINVINLPI